MLPMDWKGIASAPAKPLKACFDLTLAERRFLLGVLVLFFVGLAAKSMARRSALPQPYPPPQDLAQP